MQRARRYPAEICDECSARLPPAMFFESWGYCQHARVMVYRGRTHEPWIIVPRIKPKRALAMLKAAIPRIVRFCKNAGLTEDEIAATMDVMFDARARGAGDGGVMPLPR